MGPALSPITERTRVRRLPDKQLDDRAALDAVLDAGRVAHVAVLDESERLLRGFLSKALFDAGLYCRADDRGDPVIQLSPPLICDQSHFDEIEQILRSVLTEAWARL